MRPAGESGALLLLWAPLSKELPRLLLLVLLPMLPPMPALAPLLLPLLGRVCTTASVCCSVSGTDAPSGPTVTTSSGSTEGPEQVLLCRRTDGPRSNTRWQKLSSSSRSSSARHALLVDACSRLRPLASCLLPEKLPPLAAATPPSLLRTATTPLPPLLACSIPAALPIAVCGAAPAELGLLLLLLPWALPSVDALTAAMAAGSLSVQVRLCSRQLRCCLQVVQTCAHVGKHIIFVSSARSSLLSTVRDAAALLLLLKLELHMPLHSRRRPAPGLLLRVCSFSCSSGTAWADCTPAARAAARPRAWVVLPTDSAASTASAVGLDGRACAGGDMLCTSSRERAMLRLGCAGLGFEMTSRDMQGARWAVGSDRAWCLHTAVVRQPVRVVAAAWWVVCRQDQGCWSVVLRGPAATTGTTSRATWALLVDCSKPAGDLSWLSCSSCCLVSAMAPNKGLAICSTSVCCGLRLNQPIVSPQQTLEGASAKCWWAAAAGGNQRRAM